ncbi:XRE family transcriptional regulator [Paraburkholderia nodosa]|uniref:XRE family transcriptional regulator n=1 Tax=Paraburkholderia nodosa TaxID=392320 RepID=UPI000488534E|nr:XRE family transcriptional regulator [Paraburkholderia nodosa]
MESIGARLREERQRLRLSQVELATLGGIGKQAQLRYEKDERVPDAAYLASIETAGVDVLYIVTGRRNTSDLSADESDLVRRYRDAPEAVRAAALGALAAGTVPSKFQQDFRGANVGQQVSGDVTGAFTINMGSSKARKKQNSESD